MRYAKSLFYGVLLDSENADYKDYVNWMLRCPKCGEPVHLVGASVRREHTRIAPKSKQIVPIKQANVSSSFAHFKGLANDECENFSKSINPGFVSIYQSISRRQRLEIFNKHFLAIIGYPHEVEGAYFTFFKSVNRVNNKLAKAAYDAIIGDYYTLICNSHDFSEASRLLIEGAKGQLDVFSYENKKPSYCLDFVDLVNRIDIDMQLSVLQEVHKFLKSSAARRISTQIFDYSFAGFIQSTTDEECQHLLAIGSKSQFHLKQDYGILLTAMGRLFYQSLTFVDWYAQVQKLSAQ